MKKLLAALLALGMLFALCACGNNDDGKGGLDDYLQDEVVIDYYVTDSGETFYFDAVDTESVTITDYRGSDVAHTLNIPAEINGKKVVAIAEGAFYYCSKINAISFPASVTTIGKAAFAGCALITNLQIPATVTSIGEKAFYDCTGLREIVFENGSTLASIGDYAFGDCILLRDVSIPASVKTIGSAAFKGCEALSEVVLAEGVETVGDGAFLNCTALSDLTLPASLTTIGKTAFSGSENLFLQGVTVPEGSVAEAYITAMKLADAPEA